MPSVSRHARTTAVCCILSATPVAAMAQATSTPVSPSIAVRTAEVSRRDGFLPIYLDPHQGRILLELLHDSTRALLMNTQATGLGSNPIGIDRGLSAEYGCLIAAAGRCIRAAARGGGAQPILPDSRTGT